VGNAMGQRGLKGAIDEIASTDVVCEFLVLSVAS
jgi:hypothetical protein